MKTWIGIVCVLWAARVAAQHTHSACLYTPTQAQAQTLGWHSRTEAQHLTADGQNAKDIYPNEWHKFAFDTLLVQTYWVQQPEHAAHNLALVLRHNLRTQHVHVTLSSRYGYSLPVAEIVYEVPAAYFSENSQSLRQGALYHDLFVEMDAEGYPHLKELLLRTPTGGYAWLVFEDCR